MKAFLIVLLILAAGAGAWFSGLSGDLADKKGLYQEFQEWIAARKQLQKENVEWTVLRDDMVKFHQMEEEEHNKLTTNKATATRQKEEQESIERDLTDKSNELTAELDSIAAKEKKLRDELQSILDKYQIDNWENLGSMVDAREAQNKQLQSDVEKIQADIVVATGKRNEQQTELNGRQKEQADYRTMLSKNSDEFAVLSVEPQWGFVVIGAGSENSTIDNNTVLLVTRNGRSIGKLRVSSLEKKQTIADVVEGSVPAGMSIQPGDTVQLLNPKQSLK